MINAVQTQSPDFDWISAEFQARGKLSFSLKWDRKVGLKSFVCSVNTHNVISFCDQAIEWGFSSYPMSYCQSG